MVPQLEYWQDGYNQEQLQFIHRSETSRSLWYGTCLRVRVGLQQLFRRHFFLHVEEVEAVEAGADEKISED